MDRKDFLEKIKSKVLILDGASGTLLQQRGMPAGVCPEQWAVDNPELIIELHQDYINAGSDVIYTFTFGANRIKLNDYSLGDRTYELNKELALLARKAAGDKALVAGDISSTGQFVYPFGQLPFEEAVQIFKEQAIGLADGGADFIIIETISDIQEARAALIAVKEATNLPVCVSMTYEKEGRTLTGTDPTVALITLQSLGANVVGCNCSTGPELMKQYLTKMKEHANVPLLVKPNAGLPKIVDGKTVFEMEPVEYANSSKSFLKLGANLVGGCCGTTPAHIAELSAAIARTSKAEDIDIDIDIDKDIVYEDKDVACEKKQAVTSARTAVYIDGNMSNINIGNIINANTNKELAQELSEGNTALLIDLALEQAGDEVDIINVNVFSEGTDESKAMILAIEALSVYSKIPLCIDSKNIDVIETALRIYPGRLLVSKKNLYKEKLQSLQMLSSKYGAILVD